MTLTTDGYTFNFPTAIELFKFDEIEKSSPHYHGSFMKGVDVVAEFESKYLFIEIKDYDDIDEFRSSSTSSIEEIKKSQKAYKWLKNYLKYKFRDSFLYRFAEEKVEKPVHYICLMNFDSQLNSKMKKDLQRELPFGKKGKRWKKSIADSVQVLNLASWNSKDIFKDAQLIKLP